MASEPSPPAGSSPAPSDAPSPASTGAGGSTLEPRGLLDTLVAVYTEPAAAFRAIAARPAWVAPFVGIILLNVAFTFVWLKKADPAEVARTQMEEAGVFERLPLEQHAAIVERQARLLPVFAWLGPLVFAPVGFVALAALFLFIYRFFYASETSFSQSLAVVSWSLFAVALVSTPLTLLVLSLKGEWSVDPRTVIQANPGAFIERTTVPKPVHALLDAIDLFSAWILFLLSAGYAATARRSIAAAAAGVLALWGIYVLLKVALAFIF